MRYIELLAFLLKSHVRKGRTRLDPDDPSAYRDDPSAHVHRLLPKEVGDLSAWPGHGGGSQRPGLTCLCLPFCPSQVGSSQRTLCFHTLCCPGGSVQFPRWLLKVFETPMQPLEQFCMGNTRSQSHDALQRFCSRFRKSRIPIIFRLSIFRPANGRKRSSVDFFSISQQGKSKTKPTFLFKRLIFN